MAYAVFGPRPNSHPFQERKVSLQEPLKVGRAVAKCKSAANNLIFDCKVLSRNHAIVWYENGKFYIQDTNSSNGTYVNNSQVGKGANETEATEIKSGDVLQFGVDVTENSKKVTHGCIIALVSLVHPDGTEAYGEPERPANGVLSFVDADHTSRPQELWQVSKCLKDALNREQLLEQKLATMQRMIENSTTSADEAFQAFVKEDELLSRLDTLENQLEIITKELSEDDFRKLLINFQKDKENYEIEAKGTIRKLIEERSDSLKKLADIQRSLSYSEDECTHFKTLHEKSEDDIKALMDRNEQLSAEVTQCRDQLDLLNRSKKDFEEKAKEEKKKFKTDAEEAERRASTLAVQVESLQAECDFTKEQLSAMKEKLEKQQADTSANFDDSNSTHHIVEQTRLQRDLYDNLLQINKYIKGLTDSSTDEIDERYTDLSSLDKDEPDLGTSLEACINFAKYINDELAIAVKVSEKSEKTEEDVLLIERLNTAQGEVLEVQSQIDLLHEKLALEQATSQKYKDIASEFEVRLGREALRRIQLMASFEVTNSRLKELQERLNDEAQLENLKPSENDIAAADEVVENVSIEEVRMVESVEDVLLEEPATHAQEKHLNPTNDGRDLSLQNFSEELNTTKAQKNQLLYLLFALVTLIVAIGAAWMLDVIQVSPGQSPIWKELYEHLF